MTCAVVTLPTSAPPRRRQAIRASIFWSVVLLVIVSPAVLSALILMRG